MFICLKGCFLQALKQQPFLVICKSLQAIHRRIRESNVRLKLKHLLPNTINESKLIGKLTIFRFLLLNSIKIIFQAELLMIEIGINCQMVPEINFIHIVLYSHLTHQTVRIYCRLNLFRNIQILIITNKYRRILLVLIMYIITCITKIESKRLLIFQLEQGIKRSLTRFVIQITV